MDLGLKNAEGYYDLTAFEAIRNICEAEKKKKLSCICFLYEDDTEEDMKNFSTNKEAKS